MHVALSVTLLAINACDTMLIENQKKRKMGLKDILHECPPNFKSFRGNCTISAAVFV